MNVKREALDFAAHAGMSLLLLAMAWALGCTFTPAGAIAIAWGCGFFRQFGEWQCGGPHPISAPSILDQVGWIYGGVCFIFVTS
jgi:hypothetical protein